MTGRSESGRKRGEQDGARAVENGTVASAVRPHPPQPTRSLVSLAHSSLARESPTGVGDVTRHRGTHRVPRVVRGDRRFHAASRSHAAVSPARGNTREPTGPTGWYGRPCRLGSHRRVGSPYRRARSPVPPVIALATAPFTTTSSPSDVSWMSGTLTITISSTRSRIGSTTRSGLRSATAPPM